MHSVSSNAVRFLTKNFVLDKITEKQSPTVYNWRKACLEDANNKMFYDTKNYVFCFAPTFNVRCLSNYYDLLNQTYEYWLEYGLFDHGYKPYIYLPSFWGDPHITDLLIGIARGAGVSLLAQEGHSLMYSQKPLSPREYWVKQEGVNKIADYIIEEFVPLMVPEEFRSSIQIKHQADGSVLCSEILRALAQAEEIGG